MAPVRHPGKNSEHMFASGLSPRTVGNHLFAAGLKSYVPMIRLPLTPRHRQARLLWCHERVDWRMEWRSVVVSDESSFVCVRVINVHVYGVGLVSVIFRSVFAHDTQAPLQVSWCGGA